MKQFLTFVQKEFYHLARDRWSMIISVLLPIVMLVLFGFMMSTEVRNTKFAVYDPSHDVATHAIVNKIAQSEYFIFDGYLHNPKQIDDVFKKGEVGLVIVFSERFNENMQHTGDAQIQLVSDGSDPNNATTVSMYATNIIASYQQEQMGEMQVPFQINQEVKLLYNPTLKGAYNFVPGVMGMILMLICAMMTSVAIAREKELNTMEVLLVSPMRPIQLIISKVVPYFVLSMFNLTNTLLISYFIMDVPIRGSLGLLIAVSLLFIFVSLALGLLISSVAETQLVAILFSAMVLMMPVMLLSGMMFPVESMPVVLQPISQVIPAKWFISAVKKVMIQGLGFSSIYQEFTVLSVMAVFLIGLSVKRFKYRLE